MTFLVFFVMIFFMKSDDLLTKIPEARTARAEVRKTTREKAPTYELAQNIATRVKGIIDFHPVTDPKSGFADVVVKDPKSRLVKVQQDYERRSVKVHTNALREKLGAIDGEVKVTERYSRPVQILIPDPTTGAPRKVVFARYFCRQTVQPSAIPATWQSKASIAEIGKVKDGKNMELGLVLYTVPDDPSSEFHRDTIDFPLPVAQLPLDEARSAGDTNRVQELLQDEYAKDLAEQIDSFTETLAVVDTGTFL